MKIKDLVGNEPLYCSAYPDLDHNTEIVMCHQLQRIYFFEFDNKCMILRKSQKGWEAYITFGQPMSKVISVWAGAKHTIFYVDGLGF